MKTVRITMTGEMLGTRVFDVESGEEIKGITRLVITHDTSGPPTVQITLMATPQLNVAMDAVLLKRPAA